MNFKWPRLALRLECDASQRVADRINEWRCHAARSCKQGQGGRRRTELKPRSVGSLRDRTGNQAMLRMSARRMPVQPSRLGAHEFANVVQQGGGAASAPILQRQEVTQEQPAGGPAQGGAAQRTGDCSGWEADVESFTKKIAEFYVQDALGTTGHGTTIDCQGDRQTEKAVP
jgi:hypothetical protein